MKETGQTSSTARVAARLPGESEGADDSELRPSESRGSYTLAAAMRPGKLILEDGTELEASHFGAEAPVAGEVVFNTGMVGYPESLTDPSYAGQILVFTYPMIGNYGVGRLGSDEFGLPAGMESDRIQVAGVVVAIDSWDVSHWEATTSFGKWLTEHGIPALCGIDTRTLTRRLRSRGTMLGKIVFDDADEIEWRDPNLENLVATVSPTEPTEYGSDGPRIALVDTGCKLNILRQLVHTGCRVTRVPWDYDFLSLDIDALFLSNGPGDPQELGPLVRNVKRALEEPLPIFGVCLGNQVLGLAAGAQTFKLPFGHRSQNQPCVEVGTERCIVTSQNHGYAVNGDTLPEGWRPWFVNANDGTNEGIRHEWKPVRSVQFHPEATPGPTDAGPLFQRFVEMIG